MSAPTTTMRGFVLKLRRRFNISFWCAVYNVFLVVMMFLSVVFSACVFLVVESARAVRAKLIVAFRREPLPPDSAKEESKLTLVREDEFAEQIRRSA